MPAPNLNLPERLKAWREKHAMTQEQAAAVIGVPFNTYRGWEIGHRSPRGLALKITLEKISK